MENEMQNTWVTKGRVPYLDALRVLAIAIVTFSHFSATVSGYWAGVFNGHFGVTLFFTISGFLITLLLLREYEAKGSISIKTFYYRRVLRIFPAYYCYLFIGFVFSVVGAIPISKAYWLSACTYMMCYMHSQETSWPIWHFWSLAVEEHFYLLWPLVLVVFAPLRALKIILAYIICVPFIRYGLWALKLDWLDIGFCSATQMSSIAMGCVCAFIVRGEAFKDAGMWLKSHPSSAVLCGIVLLLISQAATYSGKYIILFKDPVSALSCCMMMGGLLHIQNRFILRLLNNRIMFFLGALSYSFYIWQQPFSQNLLVGDMPLIWRLTGVFIAASASYFIIERPFLRLKERKVFQSLEGVCTL